MQGLKKMLKRGGSPRWMGHPLIDILWGKTGSNYRIISNVSGKWKNRVMVQFGFSRNL